MQIGTKHALHDRVAVPASWALRKRLILAIALLLGVLFSGVVGFMMFGWSAMDATYMVIITVFGVGYGEVQPVDTVGERIFVMILIIGGNSAAIYVVGELVRTITEGEIVKALGDMRESRLVEGISRHTIICGYGRIGQILARELATNGFPFVVVDTDTERIAEAHDAGFLVTQGSATEEETLVRAGIYRAAVLATVLPQDTMNVFITLTARNLNANIRIIARGEQPSTERKLMQAGASEVILPSSIGGLRIAHSITRPNLATFIGEGGDVTAHDLRHMGVEIHELDLTAASHLIGWTVGEIQRKAVGDLMVLAVKRRDGRFVKTALESLVVEEDDVLMVMGRSDGLPEFLRAEVRATRVD